jgi:proliferating cell nuclear antigen PCNA
MPKTKSNKIVKEKKIKEIVKPILQNTNIDNSNNDINTSDDYILEIKTGQCSIIKSLFEVLKEVLVDYNLIVTKNHIHINCMNYTGNTFIYLHLTNEDPIKEGFEVFNCNTPNNSPLYLGIDAQSIYKCIKTIKNDTNTFVSLLVTKDEPYKLVIKYEDMDNNNDKIFKLTLQEIEVETYDSTTHQYKVYITLPPTVLQRIFKDCNMFSTDTIDIKVIKNKVIFSCKSKDNQYEIEHVLYENDKINVQNDDDDEIIHGVYLLKFLVQFTKPTNLCTSVTFCLRNNYPLLLIYNVGDLGELRFMLSEVKDNDYSGDDDSPEEDYTDTE